MTESVEDIAPGISRQISSSAPQFENFTSISGASSKILAALSREGDSYRSIPMASVLFRAEDGYVSPGFTLAIDDLTFVNVVLSTSLREIVVAYGDGALSQMKEPDEVVGRLNSLANHWEALIPIIRGFAASLATGQEQVIEE